jgi:hypothetical protein
LLPNTRRNVIHQNQRWIHRAHQPYAFFQYFKK